MDFLLFYELTADYLSRRGEYRSEHLALAWQFADRGELLIGGALGDPVDGAILMFRCDSRETVESFVGQDPYVANGLVASFRVRPWTTVVGDLAQAPMRPERP